MQRAFSSGSRATALSSQRLRSAAPRLNLQQLRFAHKVSKHDQTRWMILSIS